MPNVSFGNLVAVAVAAVAFTVPLLLGLVPRVRLPSTVLELGLAVLALPTLLLSMETVAMTNSRPGRSVARRT